MHRSSLYHGDLVETLHGLGLTDGMDSTRARVVAGIFGFDYLPPEPRQGEMQASSPLEDEAIPEEPATPPDGTQPDPSAPRRERLGFWALTRVEHFTPEQRDQRESVPAYIADAPPNKNQDWQYPNTPQRGRPLLQWSRLWPFLRRVLGRHRLGSLPDIPRVIRLVAEGRALRHLPRQQRRIWNADAWILVDRRSGLAPFWDDFEDLIRNLRRMRGNGGLRVIHVRRGGPGLADAHSHRPFTGAAPPASGVVLALGDLGQYPATFFETAPWLALGRRLRARGIQPWAMCPCPVDRWSPEMAGVWNMAAWDRHYRLPLHGFGNRAAPPAEADILQRQEARSRQLNDLLRLASPAVRVERGLLRDLRLHLPSALADAGTEYDAFQSNEVRGSEAGFSLEVDRLKDLRREFANTSFVSLDLFCRATATLWAHHRYCRQVFGPEELEGLLEILSAPQLAILREIGVLTDESQRAVGAYWRRLAAGLVRGEFAEFSSAMASHAWSGLERLGNISQDDLGKQVIWALNHPGPNRDLPASIKPEAIAWLERLPSGAAAIEHSIALDGAGLHLGAQREDPRLFRIGSMRSSRASVTLAIGEQSDERLLQRPWGSHSMIPPETLGQYSRIVVESERSRLELSKIPRPAWASRMWYEREGLRARARVDGRDYLFGWTLDGERISPARSGGPLQETGRWKLLQPQPIWAKVFEIDDSGLRAEFHIRSVPFVLRWIPPGSFLMGSPEDEPGRSKNEGPQHEVRITRGFWMGETPVTQAQWRAVVEEARAQPKLLNRLLRKQTLDPAPSHFQGPAELPAEQVNWEDSNTFCRLLDALLPGGPGFGLPTEAQWEFACRGGTHTALYSGPIDILGENHAPALDAIAWYGGNSGLDLEVKNPDDSSGWPVKQHTHTKAATHRVKLKVPNPCGLHDMLGNVWEWCRDAWDENAYAKRVEGQADPCVGESESALRVVRGGSWSLRARGCRAAIRFRDVPGYRFRNLGLRLSAGQERGAAEPLPEERSDAEPERRSRARRAAGSKPAERAE